MKLKTLYYALPLIIVIIVLARIPAYMIAIKEIDPYCHTLKAHEIIKNGFKALYRWDYLLAHIGGMKYLYPPGYSLMLALFYRLFGLEWVNFLALALQYLLYTFSVWLLTYEFIGKENASFAVLISILFPLGLGMWLTPAPSTYSGSFTFFCIYALLKKKNLLLAFLLLLLLYFHHSGIFIYLVLLLLAFYFKELKPQRKYFIFPLLLYAPWLIYFALNYFSYKVGGAVNSFYTDFLILLSEYLHPYFLILIFLSLTFFIKYKKGTFKLRLNIFKISLIAVFISYFIFFGLAEMTTRALRITYPILAVAASSVVTLKDKASRKFLPALFTIIFFLVILFPPTEDFPVKSMLGWGNSYFGNEDILIDAEHRKMLINQYYLFGERLNQMTAPGEIIYAEGVPSCILALLSDRPVTGTSWFLNWFPKSYDTNINSYQRVNFFEKIEDVPPEFKIEAGGPLGFIAVNESYAVS